MKKLGIALAIAIASVGVAHAADLPTKKEVAPPPPVNCFASLWTYLNSTAADCPLSYGPFTAYATLDLGLQLRVQRRGLERRRSPTASGSFINKQSYGSKWLWSPNNLSQSVVGVKMSQPTRLWLVDRRHGGNRISTPIPGYLANGARSQVQNNGKALAAAGTSTRIRAATANGTTRRALSGSATQTYGTLVGGRVNTLGLDGLVSYDPMGSAYAFSPFGFSGSYAGFGDTELTRSNTALKYQLELPEFRQLDEFPRRRASRSSAATTRATASTEL